MASSEPGDAHQDGLSLKKNRKWSLRPQRLRRHRYGGRLIFFWMGMTFGAWRKLMARGRYDFTANVLHLVAPVTLWTPVNSLLHRLSEAIYAKRAEAVRLDENPPIFLLGHWRSGTTLLHDLIASDPRFAFPTTYECFLPSHFLLTERALSRATDLLLPDKRPQDDVPVGMDKPQEEEFALLNLGAGTPYVTMAWPRHGPADHEYLSLRDATEAQRSAWKEQYLFFYRRLALKHGRPLVMKSPANTARVRILLEMFPNARFVHIARNPLAVVPSTVRLWKALYSTEGLHNPANMLGWIDDHVLSTFREVADIYAEDRALIPAERLVEIRYEDLAADPKTILRDVYARLGLGDFETAEPGVDAYLSDRSAHRRATYDMPPEAIATIAERMSDYIDRFSYRADIEEALNGNADIINGQAAAPAGGNRAAGRRAASGA
jgi:hypothetical protein